MRQPRLASGGMTLLEMMIAATILAIVLAGAFDVLRLSTQGMARGDAEATTAQQLEVAVATLRADLRAAQVDSEPGHVVTLADGGREIVFARALPRGPGGRPVLAEVSYKLEPGAQRPRLMRRQGPVPGQPASAAAPTQESEVSSGITAVRFTLYSRRIQAPLLSYTTRAHSDYAPLLVRVELTASAQDVTRELVTSVALQPFSKSQLDPYWNPVTPP